jgi:tRNA(fMet)-specific endonuclease VapC
VKAELWHGAQKYGRRERRLMALDTLFRPFDYLPFDDAAAQCYATIRHELEEKSMMIGPNDLKIASICLTHRLTLAASNTREFSRVAGLQVEDWTRIE